MNKENCALKLVDEIILYYDARSKKHKKNPVCIVFVKMPSVIRMKLYRQYECIFHDDSTETYAMLILLCC